MATGATYSQTSTALGSLTSATSGSWVNVPKRGSQTVGPGGGAGPIITIASSSVTTGATINIEGRLTGQAGNTATKILHKVTVAANGTVVVPLKDLLKNGTMPDQVRVNATAYTDGTHVGAILTAS